MGCGSSTAAPRRGDFDDTSPKKVVSIVPSPSEEKTPAKKQGNLKEFNLENGMKTEKRLRFATEHADNSRQAVAADASTSKDKSALASLAAIDADRLADEFSKHDAGAKGTLTRSEITALLEKLVGGDISTAVDINGEPVLDSLIQALDADNSGEVDLDELLAAWRAWFGQALNPVRCLLIIDVQNDFISGTLRIDKCPAQQDPTKIVPVINRMRKDLQWDAVAVSLDWHPHEHCSFAECFGEEGPGPASFPLHADQPPEEAVSPPVFSSLTLLSPDGVSPMSQILWPRHCVQGSWGAECHPDLVTDEKDVIIYKGTNAEVDSYSAFYDNQKLNQTALLARLRSLHVTHLFVTGLALDVCVAFSALHAAEEGFVVTVVVDACAGVSEEGIAEKREAFQRAGITVATSEELPAIFAKCAHVQRAHPAHMPSAPAAPSPRAHVYHTSTRPAHPPSTSAQHIRPALPPPRSHVARSPMSTHASHAYPHPRCPPSPCPPVGASPPDPPDGRPPPLSCRSSLDELTQAAVRVRRAKEVEATMGGAGGHGAPVASEAGSKPADAGGAPEMPASSEEGADGSPPVLAADEAPA